MKSILLGIFLGILVYFLFVLFILALCSANKIGADEQAENDEQAEWLEQNRKASPK